MRVLVQHFLHGLNYKYKKKTKKDSITSLELLSTIKENKIVINGKNGHFK